MEQDIKEIQKVYEHRGKDSSLSEMYKGKYATYMCEEREKVYEAIIKKQFSEIKDVLLLEIGAGMGGNISFFYQLGIPFKNIVANELLNDRINQLKLNFPAVKVIEGNALNIELAYQFDIVFQSTVFTSILNQEFRKELANKMWQLVKNDGIILWYDFVYNNPANKNVKKVTKQEVKLLFPLAKKYEFHKVTLAPPIGRRVGDFYSLLNTFSFLRTHLIAVIHK